ncbi:hypothetical protein Fmac_016057 [Flemingia macrophylla]|uniref:Disease resistance R13L4/SHOC-2-like LRR domain-containing protein n=1 Tax=Flemingia macrophylla TaxID=520843 RepID=A0ABD1MGB0_9FABA
MLSTWSDVENNRDCCTWKGIECDNETGHIHMLHLRGSPRRYLSGYTNGIFSLLELQHMEYLDLSCNDFIGSQIPQHMGSFKNLRYLNLSGSSFFGAISHELGNLLKLEYLDLSSNDLGGTIPSLLGKLTRLRYLDLSDNYEINGEVPYQLGNLSQLRYLDLTGTSISGTIPFQVGNLPILHTLKLARFKIIDSKWLSSLSSLTSLVLSYLPNPVSSPQWTQMIGDLIPNLRELRLVGCSIYDDNVSSWFSSRSNFSTSLSILDLSHNMLTSSTFQLLFNYSRNLQELYLSHNNIVLSSPQFPNFASLVTLDLSFNNLTSLIFQETFNFNTSLQELFLINCSLNDGSFFVTSASTKNFSSSLVALYLSNNLLKSTGIFHWVSNFTTNLHVLWLDENLIGGPFPDGFGKVMNSLKVLALNNNNLQGEIPTSLGYICTLQQLYLSNNRFTGMLLNLLNFTALSMLDLSNNQLIGEIPKNIGLLYELMSLRLDGNYFEGDVNEFHLMNLTNLLELDLTDNSLFVKFETTWVPPFQLFNLGLASCKLGPSFPSWLHTQRYLSFLDISDAGIDDLVPEWFWNKLQSISEMNMSSNNLKGTIPNLPIKLNADDNDGTIIILRSNQFEGEIPAFLSQASILDLSENKFSNLNTFLCVRNTTTKMRSLDLSNNQIKEQLPNCWKHLKTSLEYLDVSNNKLLGKIPQSMGTLLNLQVLVLRNNRITGGLPVTLKNCTGLVILDVSKNLLSCPIPSWIGENLQQLKILSLRANQFFGSVPLGLCYLWQIHLFDLSRNNLSGEIPKCLGNITTMKEREINTKGIVRGRKITSRETYFNIYESNVLFTWKGQEQVFFNPDVFLKSIDLSSNNLKGEIPREIGYLLGLVSLNLARNNLHGEIPSEFGNLTGLDFLDLSRNHLSGQIPFSLSKIDGLGVLNLSNNDLGGRIPREGHLQTFDASSFEGNLDLCGEPLSKSCPGDQTTTKPQEPTVHGYID